MLLQVNMLSAGNRKASSNQGGDALINTRVSGRRRSRLFRIAFRGLKEDAPCR